MITKDYFVHESSYVDKGCKIGVGTKIWHFSHIQSDSVLGQNCKVGQNVNIANNVKIGNFVKIQNNVSIYEGVELEDYVFCGPSIVFTNVKRPRCEFPQDSSELYTKTLVKKSASLGANCTIMCGNTIGKYAFIGAGTVVVKDVPDYALVGGNRGTGVERVKKKGDRLKLNSNGISDCGDYMLVKNLLSFIGR